MAGSIPATWAIMVDGYLFIVGRAKDMIIINGKNHWPQDIEWAVEQLPGFNHGDIAAFSVETENGEEVARRAGPLPRLRSRRAHQNCTTRSATRSARSPGMNCDRRTGPPAHPAAHQLGQAQPGQGEEAVSFGRDRAVQAGGLRTPLQRCRRSARTEWFTQRPQRERKSAKRERLRRSRFRSASLACAATSAEMSGYVASAPSLRSSGFFAISA